MKRLLSIMLTVAMAFSLFLVTPAIAAEWFSKADFTAVQDLGTGNTGIVTTEFDVTPLIAFTSADGVIGYSGSTTATGFADFPISIRMNRASGYFDVRNGGAYASLANVAFALNTNYHIKIIAHLPNNTYDVWVTPSGGSETKIADDYVFRPDAPAMSGVRAVYLKGQAANDFKINNHTVSSVSPSLLFSDDFNDGNSTGWTAGTGWSVTNNEYLNTEQNGVATAGDPLWTNYSVEGKVRQNNASNYASIIGRYVDANNYYQLELHAQNNQLAIWKKSGGSWLSLGTYNTTIDGAIWYTIKLEMNGTSLKGYLNGVERIAVTDSSFSSGKIGLRSHKDTRFDDIKVNSLTTTNSYYSDPVSGSMTNPGTLAQPWGKLQDIFAAGKTFQPGDVIYLRSGNHGFPVITQSNTANVTITEYGSDNPIINRMDFEGAVKWVIDGVKIHTSNVPPNTNVPLQHPVSPLWDNSLVRLKDASSYITFVNCYIYSVEDSSAWTDTDWNYKAWNGIYADNETNNHHLTIENTHIKNVNLAIQANKVPYLTVRNSNIENFSGDGIRPHNNAVIEYNEIKDVYKVNGNHNDGIQFLGTDTKQNVVFRGNKLISVTSERSFKSGMQGFAAFPGKHENFIIENNIVTTNDYNGIAVYGAFNSQIVNNTVIRSPFLPTTNNPGITVQNAQDGTLSSGNAIRNNLTTKIFQTQGSVVSNNIESTAFTSLFVDYNTNDFHLKAGSAAIGAGTTTDAPSIDLDQNIRVAPYDVGAYKY